MKIINKYRVVMFVEPSIIRYKVINNRDRLTASLSEDLMEYPYQNFVDIDLLLSALQEKLPTLASFELNLHEDYIQSTKLELPQVKLNLNEILLYVEASIYKLFEMPASHAFFDFVYLAKSQKQLMVAICDRKYVNQWVELFKKHHCRLSFIGCVFKQYKFNFLPWRQSKHKSQKLYLAMTILSLIGILSCLFCYWWLQVSSELNYYLTQCSNQQIIKQNLAHQLSTYKPDPSPSQQQIKWSLLLISQILPQNIWLTSFTYTPNKVSLLGHSFNYKDITDFNLNLLQQDLIEQGHVKTISNDNQSLLFDMDLKLHE